MRTPWGESQTVVVVAPGITVVDTAGHGGIKLSPDRQAKVPASGQKYAEKWCGSRPWYEEDVAACIPILLFPELAEYFGQWNGGAAKVVEDSRSALEFYGHADIVAAIDAANAQDDLFEYVP